MTSFKQLGRGARWCEWTLVRQLSQRGRHAVFLARDARDAAVLLKLYDRVARAQILDLHARWVTLPPRPEIVSCLGFASDGGVIGLVLEWVPSRPLDDEIRGCPTASRRHAIVAALIGGLAVLHGHGYTHGDLSSSNVLCASNRVVLTDLGLGVLNEGGTPPFASSRTGSSADVHALGVLWLLLATGRSALPGVDLRDLQPCEATAIRGCIDGRYTSAQEIPPPYGLEWRADAAVSQR